MAAAPQGKPGTGAMWNARYDGEAFFYGTAPNDFLVAHAGELAGPVLALAEGEGRNAVFLAERGLDVIGVDISPVGLEKARRLASERGVHIETVVADLADYVPETARYGAVVSIFAHLPPLVRAALYPRVVAALKPGGLLVLEGYAEAQLARDTGGPKDIAMLLTPEGVRAEFAALEPVLLQAVEREVWEGAGHTGLASVVQFIGRKPA